MMRLADFVVQELVRHNIDTAFVVTGGYAMHLNDALGAESCFTKIYHHHEQAAAYAAEGYGHLTGRPALVQVTAGPGSINAMAGVFGAYVDSIPMLVISGQSKRSLLRSTYGFSSMRQLGEQEVDAVSMAQSITKYAVSVVDPSRIAFEIQKALYLSTNGRPGPVWIDIPIDVQGCLIDPDILPRFLPCVYPGPDVAHIGKTLLQRIVKAKRPLLVVGPDLLPDDKQALLELSEVLPLPVVVAGAQDAVRNDSPLYAGRMGILGTRAGNIALHNADVIVCFGLRPHIGLVTHNWEQVGAGAEVIVVDEDPTEFEKPCSIADVGLVAPAGACLRALRNEVQRIGGCPDWSFWVQWCRERVASLPAVTEAMRIVAQDGSINPYWFVETLSHCVPSDAVMVASNGSSSVIPLQAAYLNGKQRFFSNHGNGAMGFGLPAAIGASLASPGTRVFCFEGDGSLMMNVQELQTVVHHALPIVIVVFNNRGYLSIKLSQQNFFGRLAGSTPESGVSLPDFVSLAQTFGIAAVRIAGKDFAVQLEKALQNHYGPLLIDVQLDPEQGFEPKVSSRKLDDGTMVSSSPEDMYPFLERDELQKHLIFDGDH